MRYSTASDEPRRFSPPWTIDGERRLLHRRAWACDASHQFEAHTKYLQLADKASRTVALLSERLDHHRGRGQQQITVKHVTVNADQAVVTDQIVSREAKEASTAALLTSGTEKPMGILIASLRCSLGSSITRMAIPCSDASC
jgi:hypothetical protein